MWRLPKDACLAGKTVLRMPRDSTALQPSAAPTLGESSAPSSEEVTSKEFQDCLGDEGVQGVAGSFRQRHRGSRGMGLQRFRVFLGQLEQLGFI